MSMTKTCTQCHAEKPINEFHKSSRNKCGRVPICKPCACEKTRLHHLHHVANYPPDMTITAKICGSCKAEKPASEYWLDPRNIGGRKHWCIDCSRVTARERARNNTARRRAWHSKKMKDPEYVARKRAARRRDYQRNKPRYHARVKALRALTAGKLISQPCEKCGSTNVEMHHTDYSQPLLITWLCKKHHGEAHRKYA